MPSKFEQFGQLASILSPKEITKGTKEDLTKVKEQVETQENNSLMAILLKMLDAWLNKDKDKDEADKKTNEGTGSTAVVAGPADKPKSEPEAKITPAAVVSTAPAETLEAKDDAAGPEVGLENADLAERVARLKIIAGNTKIDRIL